jgi:DNA-binding NtrC family response regulator
MQKKILLVDDNEPLLGMMAVILSNAGFEVVTSGNGAQALEQTRASKFDLVITDLVMPEKEGIETIKEMIKRDPGIKIIAISGDGSAGGENYLRFAEKLGAVETVPKPFSGKILLAAVERVLQIEPRSP